MHCPYCEQKLPKLNTYMYVCPYCNGILSNALKKKSLPYMDSSHNRIYEYKYNKKQRIQRGANTHKTLNAIDKKDRNKYITKMTLLHVGAVAFAALSYALLISGDESVYAFPTTVAIAVILAYVSSFVHARRQEQFLTIYSAKDDSLQPICFYGNDDIFGVASVEGNCNAYNDLPIVVFQEIEKKHITKIHIEPHAQHTMDVEYWDRRRGPLTITIPLFEDIQIIEQLLQPPK